MPNVLTASLSRVPYNTLPISIVYRSMDRKVEREQHCIECGMPVFSISDKVIAVYDGGITTELLRTEQRSVGVICKRHRCAQHYTLEV
jgi:hypothetical protein